MYPMSVSGNVVIYLFVLQTCWCRSFILLAEASHLGHLEKVSQALRHTAKSLAELNTLIKNVLSNNTYEKTSTEATSLATSLQSKPSTTENITSMATTSFTLNFSSTLSNTENLESTAPASLSTVLQTNPTVVVTYTATLPNTSLKPEQTSSVVTVSSILVQASSLGLGNSTSTVPNIPVFSDSYDQTITATRMSTSPLQTSPSAKENSTFMLLNGSVPYDTNEQTSPPMTISSSLLQTSQSASENSTFFLTNTPVSLDSNVYTSSPQTFSSTFLQTYSSAEEQSIFTLPNVSVSAGIHEETSPTQEHSSTVLQTLPFSMEDHTALPFTSINTETSTQMFTNGSVSSLRQSSFTVVEQSSFITPLSLSTMTHPEYENTSSTLSQSDLTSSSTLSNTFSSLLHSFIDQQTSSFSNSSSAVTNESSTAPIHFSSAALPLQTTPTVNTRHTPVSSPSLATSSLTTSHEISSPLTSTTPSWLSTNDITTIPTQSTSTIDVVSDSNTAPVLNTSNLTTQSNTVMPFSSNISTLVATTPTLTASTTSIIPESVVAPESGSSSAPAIQEHGTSYTPNIPFSTTVFEPITSPRSREDTLSFYNLNISSPGTIASAAPTTTNNPTLSNTPISSNIHETSATPTSRTTHTSIQDLSSEYRTSATVHTQDNYSSSSDHTLTSSYDPPISSITRTYSISSTDESVSTFIPGVYFNTSHKLETSSTPLFSYLPSSVTSPSRSSSLTTTSENPSAASNSSMFIPHETTASSALSEPITLQTARSHLLDTHEPVISSTLSTFLSTMPTHTASPVSSSSLSNTNVSVETLLSDTSLTTTLVPITLSTRSNPTLATTSEANASSGSSTGTPANMNEPLTSTISLTSSLENVSSLHTSFATSSIPITPDSLDRTSTTHLLNSSDLASHHNYITLPTQSSHVLNATNKAVTLSTLDGASSATVNESFVNVTSNASTVLTTQDITIRTTSESSTVTDTSHSVTLPLSNTTGLTIKSHSTMLSTPTVSFLTTLSEPVTSLSNSSFSTDVPDNFSSDVIHNASLLASTYESTLSPQSSSSTVANTYRDTTSSSALSTTLTSPYVAGTTSPFSNITEVADALPELNKTGTTPTLETVIPSLSSGSTFIATQELLSAAPTGSATPEFIESSSSNSSYFTDTFDSETYSTLYSSFLSAENETVTSAASAVPSVATVNDPAALNSGNISTLTTTQISISAELDTSGLTGTQETTLAPTQSSPSSTPSSLTSDTTLITDTSSQETLPTSTIANVPDTERTRKQSGDHSRRRGSKGRRSIAFQNKYERHRRKRSKPNTHKNIHAESLTVLGFSAFLKGDESTRNTAKRKNPIQKILRRRKREWGFSTTQTPDPLKLTTHTVTSENLEANLGSSLAELSWWERVNVTVIKIAQVMTEVENGPVNVKQVNQLEKAASSLDELVKEGSNITQLVTDVSVEELELMIDKLSSVEEVVHNTSLNVVDKIEKKKHLNSIIIISASGSTVALVLLVLILAKRRPWRRAIVIYITDTKRTRRCNIEAGHVYLDNDSLGMSTGSFTSYSDGQDFSDVSSVENAYPMAIIKEIRT